jgi:gamma-glutamylaminecyclotransferase
MGIRTENNNNHASTTMLIFTQRTLKRGFSNYFLMQDLIKTGDAVFNGIYRNEQGSLQRGCRVWGGGVLRAIGHRSYAIEIVFSCYLCLQFCILYPSSFICIVLTLKGENKRRRFPAVYVYKKKRSGFSRVCPGRSGSESTCWVDRVSPGQLLGGFLLRPGPVPGPGRPAGPVRVSKLWLLFLKIFF